MYTSSVNFINEQTAYHQTSFIQRTNLNKRVNETKHFCWQVKERNESLNKIRKSIVNIHGSNSEKQSYNDPEEDALRVNVRFKYKRRIVYHLLYHTNV